LHKLTKTESHQILGGGLPEALSLDIKTPAKQRDLNGKFKKETARMVEIPAGETA